MTSSSSRPVPGQRRRDEVRRRAGRGRRRLAGGARQRRARGHGRGEAGQRRLHHPRLRRPGRSWPGPRATTRPGAGRSARRRRCWRSSRTPGGSARDTRSYADSLDDPGNEKVFQRHWIGLTPTDAVLPRIPGRAAGPLASRRARERHPDRARAGLLHRASSASSTPAPVRPLRRPAIRARAATRWSPRCRASGASSP